MVEVVRRPPLAMAAIRAGKAVMIAPAPPAARYVLRGGRKMIAAAAAPLGFILPQVACRATSSGAVSALWLGPDEWLVLAPCDEGPKIAARLAEGLLGAPHALVDVSHRQGGILLSGPEATTVLNAGCPLDFDPDAFPIGMCTRTVLAKTEVVLWRTGAEAFRAEAWRSFLPYLWRYLEEAAREFEAG